MHLVSRRFVVLTCTVLLAASVISACYQTAPGTDPNRTATRGYTALTAHQLALYVAGTYYVLGGQVGGCGTTAPYRATVKIETLARFYVWEGNAQRIRGDIAFAQSILETGWFSFPDCGSVRPWYNNFAGIGATGNPADVNHWAHAQTGVRAQIQRLHNYADKNATAASLSRPFVPQRLMWTPHQYNTFFYNGKADTWQRLTGRWATSPCYDTKILRLYNKMRTHFGLQPEPARQVPGC